MHAIVNAGDDPQRRSKQAVQFLQQAIDAMNEPRQDGRLALCYLELALKELLQSVDSHLPFKYTSSFLPGLFTRLHPSFDAVCARCQHMLTQELGEQAAANLIKPSCERIGEIHTEFKRNQG